MLGNVAAALPLSPTTMNLSSNSVAGASLQSNCAWPSPMCTHDSSHAGVVVVVVVVVVAVVDVTRSSGRRGGGRRSRGSGGCVATDEVAQPAQCGTRSGDRLDNAPKNENADQIKVAPPMYCIVRATSTTRMAGRTSMSLRITYRCKGRGGAVRDQFGPAVQWAAAADAPAHGWGRRQVRRDASAALQHWFRATNYSSHRIRRRRHCRQTLDSRTALPLLHHRQFR